MLINSSIMKKIFFILSIPFVISAQDAFKKGTTVLNAGIGLGNYYGYGWFAQGYSAIPFINASLDHSFYNLDENIDLGIGGYFGFQSISYTSQQAWYTKNGNYKSGTVTQRWNYYSFGVRPSIHFSLKDAPVDLYGALLIGYTVVSYNVNDPDYYYAFRGSRPVFGLIAGGRYYFNSKTGLYLEAGYGHTMLNLGVSFKF